MAMSDQKKHNKLIDFLGSVDIISNMNNTVQMPVSLLLETAEYVKMELLECDHAMYMCWVRDSQGEATRFRPGMKDEHARLTKVYKRVSEQVIALEALMPEGTEWKDLTYVLGE